MVRFCLVKKNEISTRGTNSMPFLFFRRDHLRSTSGLVICGPIWRSFLVWGSFADGDHWLHWVQRCTVSYQAYENGCFTISCRSSSSSSDRVFCRSLYFASRKYRLGNILIQDMIKSVGLIPTVIPLKLFLDMVSIFYEGNIIKEGSLRCRLTKPRYTTGYKEGCVDVIVQDAPFGLFTCENSASLG